MQMSRRRYQQEEIIPLLRRADVELCKGKMVPEVCKMLGIPLVVGTVPWSSPYPLTPVGYIDFAGFRLGPTRRGCLNFGREDLVATRFGDSDRSVEMQNASCIRLSTPKRL